MVIRQVHDQGKVERLRHLLNKYKEKGTPKPYEIFIDTLKVVEKTEDPVEFDGYQDFMDEDSEELRILIYNSNASPRNDQHVFELKPKQREVKPETNSLSGADVDQRIAISLEAERKKWDMEQLQKENEKLKADLKEAEEYIETIETAYKEEKENKFKLGKINVGELASVALEGIIRRNPQLISKIPGGEALAGVIEEDNQEKLKLSEKSEPETETTYQKVEPEQTPKLSAQDEEGLVVVRMMQQSFDKPQLEKVWLVIGRMAEDNSLIETICDLIEPAEKEKEVEQTKKEDNEEEISL